MATEQTNGSTNFIFSSNFKKDVFAIDNAPQKVVDNDTLPFTSKGGLFVDNEIVNSFNINSILNRLLDNDKFIAKYIATREAEKTMPPNAVSSQLIDSIANINLSNVGIDSIQMSAEYETFLNTHNRTYHEENDFNGITRKTINVINSEYSDVSCNRIDFENQQFTINSRDKHSSNDTQSIENDVVKEFEFEDMFDEDIFVNVNIYNKMTNWNPSNVLINDSDLRQSTPSLKRVPWILKKYASGIKELYVNVPTTFTFYNSTGPNLENGYTIFELLLHKEHFDIHDIYQINITGNSLPLNIDTTTTKYQYNDIILPSFVRTWPVGNEPVSGEITLNSKNNIKTLDSTKKFWKVYFCNYGTDAQSIRVMFD